MGLLDQVLGQVLGRLGGGQDPGSQQGGGFSQGGGGSFMPGSGSGQGGSFMPQGNQGGGFSQGGAGYPQGGGFAQGGAPGGGLGGLPGGIGNMLSGQGGPIALAILALLASKHMQSGAGGYGSILHDMFTGGRGDSGLAQGQLPGGGGMLGQNEAAPSGGFMGEIGNMLGGGQSASGGAGAIGAGGLGGLLAGGLGELVNRFHQNGLGDVASSWVGTGPNQALSPSDLENSLGSNTVDDLSRQTGMDRDDLLCQLSQALPQVVDQLTPNGRLPTEDEGRHWV